MSGQKSNSTITNFYVHQCIEQVQWITLISFVTINIITHSWAILLLLNNTGKGFVMPIWCWNTQYGIMFCVYSSLLFMSWSNDIFNIYGAVSCSNNPDQVSILRCNCMTYYDEKVGILVGPCPYGCGSFNDSLGPCQSQHVYHPLPMNVSRLNNAMCGWLNRDG